MSQPNEQLENLLTDWEKKYNVVYNNHLGRENLLHAAASEVGFINGSWRNKARGTAVDMENYFINKAKTTNLTRTKNFTERYVSVFRQRSEEKKAQHTAQMKQVLEKEFEFNHIEFKFNGAKETLINILAERFLAVDAEDGIRYHYIYNNSIASPKSWSLDELLKESGAKKYIDENKTTLAQRLHFEEIESLARKITTTGKSGQELTLAEINSDKTITMEKAIKMVKTVATGGFKVGKRLEVNESEIASEFKKRALVNLGRAESTLSQREINMMESNVAQEVERVNSIESVRSVIGEIAHESPATDWEL